MRRTAITVTLVVVMLLLHAPGVMAGGGEAPPQQGLVLSGPTVQATILLDPHMTAKVPFGSLGGLYDVTTTAKLAFVALELKQGQRVFRSQALFRIPAGTALFRGCDVTLTGQRFVFSAANPKTLRSWIPQDVLTALFADLGITVSLNNDPVITQVVFQQCLTDPNPVNQGVIADGGDGLFSQPGWLTMEAVIEFLALK